MATDNYPPEFQLEGGRKWLRKESGVPGYSSAGGEFDILQGAGYCVLVSFEHEPNDPGQEFWRKRFDHYLEAAEYAEKM